MTGSQNKFLMYHSHRDPLSIFVLFSNYYTTKIVDLSRMRTQIVRVEGKHGDHLVTTTATGKQVLYLT